MTLVHITGRGLLEPGDMPHTPLSRPRNDR
jgi:hypothetical protein